MKTLMLISLFIGGVAAGGIGTLAYQSEAGSCSALLDMAKAQEAKELERQRQEKDFLTNQGKPIPFPEFHERGL